PQPATPEAGAATVLEIVQKAKWDGPIGITVPSIVKGQMVLSAANIDKSWIGTDAYELFHWHLGSERHISILNDADAAGLAEVAFEKARQRPGRSSSLWLARGSGPLFLWTARCCQILNLGT